MRYQYIFAQIEMEGRATGQVYVTNIPKFINPNKEWSVILPTEEPILLMLTYSFHTLIPIEKLEQIIVARNTKHLNDNHHLFFNHHYYKSDLWPTDRQTDFKINIWFKLLDFYKNFSFKPHLLKNPKTWEIKLGRKAKKWMYGLATHIGKNQGLLSKIGLKLNWR